MGNCVACVDKNNKGKKEFGGLASNDNKNKPVVKQASDLAFDKGNFILTNDGKFSEKYSMGNLLGQGAFGEVRKCQNRTTKVIRAVKIIKKEQMTPEEEKSFKYEISILKKLDHPNIIKLYEIFED